jgi:hypothetical protein
MALDRSRCIDPHKRIDALASIVEAGGGSSTINVQDEGTPIGSFHTINIVGATFTASDAGSGVAELDVSGGAGTQNLFESIAVTSVGGGSASGAALVADSTTDTATIDAGANITLLNVPATDTLRISVSGINVFDEIVVDGSSTVAAGTVSDQVEFVASTGMTITTNTGTTPKQIIFASSGGGGSGFGLVWGYLDGDMTIDDATGTLNVEDWAGSDPGATVTPDNPEDLLHSDSPKYLFHGNENGFAVAADFDGNGYGFIWVQPPTQRPV